MTTTTEDYIQLLLGPWHLPGGDITINQEDIDQMNKCLNSGTNALITNSLINLGAALNGPSSGWQTPSPSVSSTKVSPSEVLIYALIKYHHKYNILLPPSALEPGIQSLSQRFEVSNWTQSAMRAFWNKYMKLSFTNDPEFGTQQGVLRDWQMYVSETSTLKLKWLNGVQAPFIEADIQWEKVMHDMTEFDNNVIQREFDSQLLREGYRTELNAQWAIGQADYEIWKSQIS
jgi:hypothetical protein